MRGGDAFGASHYHISESSPACSSGDMASPSTRHKQETYHNPPDSHKRAGGDSHVPSYETNRGTLVSYANDGVKRACTTRTPEGARV